MSNKLLQNPSMGTEYLASFISKIRFLFKSIPLLCSNYFKHLVKVLRWRFLLHILVQAWKRHINYVSHNNPKSNKQKGL